MKNRTAIFSAMVYLSTAAAAPAFSQERGHDDGRAGYQDNRDRGNARGEHDRGEHDRGERDRGERDRGEHDRGRNDYGRIDYGRHDRGSERGAGPRHDLYRGQRLSDEYRSRQYVVDDWRGHRLSAPPRGYHWVQAGGDYVLVAVATGVIANILLNH